MESKDNEDDDKHARDDITQVEGLADYGEDVVVMIVRELVPKQPDRHNNIPELVIYGLYVLNDKITVMYSNRTLT